MKKNDLKQKIRHQIRLNPLYTSGKTKLIGPFEVTRDWQFCDDFTRQIAERNPGLFEIREKSLSLDKEPLETGVDTDVLPTDTPSGDPGEKYFFDGE